MASSQTTVKPLKSLVFIINGEITVKEGDADAWLAAFSAAREHVLAEPECHFFVSTHMLKSAGHTVPRPDLWRLLSIEPRP